MSRGLLVVIGAFVAVALAVVAARAVLAGPTASQPLTFRDHHDPDLVLTIETSPFATQVGMFTMRVPGRGLYVSRSGAHLKVNGDHEDRDEDGGDREREDDDRPASTVARYSGDADLMPRPLAG